METWATKLSGGRVVVALVNAFSFKRRGQPGWYEGPVNITANWGDIWLTAGQRMHVRDAIGHKDLGAAAGSVSAVVGSGENETLAAAPVRLEVVRNLTCSEGLADNKNQSIRTRWN